MNRIIIQVDESLKRLKTDYINLYQIHSSDPQTPIEETLNTLDDLVRAGKIRYAVASNIEAWHLMKTLTYPNMNVRKASFFYKFNIQ